MIVSGVAGLIGQVIGLFGARGKATQEQLKARVESMGRSWTDEFIAVVWFSPLVAAWFSPERANEWIAAVTSNVEYFAMVGAITAAVFGLGKLNGRQ
jgi:hypothetical protein